jgi:hypothetical protein
MALHHLPWSRRGALSPPHVVNCRAILLQVLMSCQRQSRRDDIGMSPSDRLRGRSGEVVMMDGNRGGHWVFRRRLGRCWTGQRGCTSLVDATSIVIASLEKIYPVTAHQIDEAMFLRQPTGPDTCREGLQRFGFANTPERVTQNGFNQIKGAQGDPTSRGDPVAQIFAELWVKDRVALVWGSGLPPAPPIAAARHERRLSAVACKPLFGRV